MSSKDNYEPHHAEFHLETDLEAMEVFQVEPDESPTPPSVGRYQSRPTGQISAGGQQQPLATRRLGYPLPELLRRQDTIEFRRRSQSVPVLELRHRSREIAISLKQIGDEYFEIRSPTRKNAMNSERRRSSVDFQSGSAPESERSWIASFLRRMSGVDIVPPPADRGEAAGGEAQQ